jgi:hypothetical protein
MVSSTELVASPVSEVQCFVLRSVAPIERTRVVVLGKMAPPYFEK